MPRSVLVTGATGTLGHHVVPEATQAGHAVRALSRRPRVGYTGVHWQQGDLSDAGTLDAALDGIDTVVHCATQPTGDKDIVAARNLTNAVRRNNVGHLIYVSIVGIDKIPLPYYRTKLRVEQLLADSGVPHTIQRATQFHELIEKIFDIQRFSPVLVALRDVRFQPIDTRDVASRLVELIDQEPGGRVTDMGGPEVVEHPDLAQMYLAAHSSRRRVVRFTPPGRIAAGYRSGAHLTPDNAVGTVTFQQYLASGT
ncbi:SDR family oxidoreductase [Mycolicibacterium smegmatis]|uniref:SDR family oxidoreductase n=1 Tax=Mycolicibacterium smegmatis TaxID=1772 RepID=UPI001E64744D|nr:NAD(P)H-binding protein [Mycolicibacterium smegmatis]UGU34320.1 NAD(P)H-binding protein [Mycolicibacterium smegmatis]ULN34293.1 NAD(P)H-binding protein [Mycolicibacterium smegmatis]ULN69156.1 NAD(P)H-binding protein [Mycolicibacterium smegmatis]